jgi:hypothetical protein
MPVGDDATAAGFPLVPASGTGSEVHNGYLEINRTRDFVAQVKALVLSVWPVSRGGTGSANAAGARNNLGIYSGTDAPSDVVGGNVDGNIYIQIQS